MKNILIALMIFIANVSWSQQNAQDIVGSWLMKPGKGETLGTIVEIFEYDSKFYAYGYGLTDGSHSTAIDSKNPDPALRTRSMKDVIFLYGISFNQGKWQGGEIYRPSDGSYFHVKGELSDLNTLRLRASIDKTGIFGETQIWTRLSDEEQAKFESHKTPKSKLIKFVSELKYHKK
ncbi:MAG: DUF2147 domain-containing protein [Brevinema sp.]